MTLRDIAQLLALAALWGASYLFMRLEAGAFGALALAALRAGLAGVLLLGWLAMRGELPALRRHWRPIALVGLSNSALPYVCFSYASHSIEAGMASIFSAATPLFGALVARLWLGEALQPRRLLGLLIGLGGVAGLAWRHAGLQSGVQDTHLLLALGACLLAPLAYGFSVCFTQRYLTQVPPLAAATGSQLAAALVLALPAASTWPAAMPGATAWGAAVALAVACTAMAYPLFFGLIARIGHGRATTVTFLIPLFAMAWGLVFLGEHITADMVVGGAVVLVGTALSLRRSPASQPGSQPHAAQSRPASSAALPPAAAVFTVSVCSAQKR